MENFESEREKYLRMTSGHRTSTTRKSKEKTQTAETPEQSSSVNKKSERKGFNEVAGMDELKRLVTEGFINVLNNKERAAVYDITPPAILFYGPAGCGKTFFAEKIAEETGLPIIKIVPDDIASKWLHGTQQKIDKVFSDAEKKAPVILFFDEFDAMVPHRSSDENDQHTNGEVNEFLCKLNNASQRGIYVIAATNYPQNIDKAVLRTGRIDEMIYIDMPDTEARKALFQISLAKLPADANIDYDRLATLTEGYSCSDISYIVKASARTTFNLSLKDTTAPCLKIDQSVLEDSIHRRTPSVSTKDLKEYERVRNELTSKESTNRPVRIGYK